LTVNENKPTGRRKIYGSLIVGILIIISVGIFLQMDLIRNLFGLPEKEGTYTYIILKYAIIGFLVLGGIVGFFLLLKIIYKKIPLKGEFVEANKLVQKKLFLPNYRVSILIKVKGIPRNTPDEKNKLDQEEIQSLNWDIVSSLSNVCDELNFWIMKHQNRIQLFFTISGWSWFSKKKAETKAEKGILSLKSSFNNINPSILFEEINVEDSFKILSIIKDCKYGLETKGIPALKRNKTQIDRIVNTFNSINENCYYVVCIKGLKRGRERKGRNKLIQNKDEKDEIQSDYLESKKTGQSNIGVFAFSESEEGMYTLFAAMLSIWSGTHTFHMTKLGNCDGKNLLKNMQKMDPPKATYISNKALSSYLHLPEKPFFTENTSQPVFEIPAKKEINTKNEITIGNIIQNDRILDEYNLPIENLHFNVEIVGMIGRGKTYLVAKIIEQLLDADLGCLVFDLKGEYAKLFVNDPHVLVYTIGQPAPLGINLFDMNSDNEVQNILALICEMLTIAGTPFSPTMLNIFETALQKVSKKKVKNIKVFMQCLSESSEEYTKNMKTSYSRDSIDAILNRLNYIFGGVNFEVFSALENTIDFSVLDEGKKVILDFSEYLRRGASTASLFLVCNLVLHLLSKHASIKGITNVLRYLVILEEAMYLIPKRFNLDSTASIGYSEQNFIMGRSLGIGTISIYQLWNSVSSVVHANSLTKILFRNEETEKIKPAINLSIEQYNYLPNLPDRNFIIKSKTLSGPALLKTKTFTRAPYSNEDYLKIVKEKFRKNGFTYSRISGNLMELRKEIFEKKSIKSYDTNRSSVKTSIGDYTSSTNRIKSNETIDHKFNEYFWENCITLCPLRLKYKEKKSNWLKHNYCIKIQNKARKIAAELISHNDKSLIEILNSNPEYLVNKILDFYKESSETLVDPEIHAFCTVNIIVNTLSREHRTSNQWKNNVLNRIKHQLYDKTVLDYSVY